VIRFRTIERSPGGDRNCLLTQIRLLTPAPDTAAIAWKKAALAAGQYRYTDVKTERVERAIADDVAFLDAHPTRTKMVSS
jgi:hypothetical protein